MAWIVERQKLLSVDAVLPLQGRRSGLRPGVERFESVVQSILDIARVSGRPIGYDVTLVHYDTAITQCAKAGVTIGSARSLAHNLFAVRRACVRTGVTGERPVPKPLEELFRLAAAVEGGSSTKIDKALTKLSDAARNFIALAREEMVARGRYVPAIEPEEQSVVGLGSRPSRALIAHYLPDAIRLAKQTRQKHTVDARDELTRMSRKIYAAIARCEIDLSYNVLTDEVTGPALVFLRAIQRDLQVSIVPTSRAALDRTARNCCKKQV